MVDGAATTYGVGQYAASERHLAFYPLRYRRDGTKRGAIYAHSHGNTALEAQSLDSVMGALALGGIPAISCDLGGVSAWGNDTAIARVSDAKTYLQGTLGAKTGSVFLLCYSMGAATLLNWARANVSSVAAFAGVAPAVDVAGLYAANTNGATAEINTAYGSAGAWAAAAPTHDPNQFAATLTFPQRLYYGTADTAVTPAMVSTYAANVGGSNVSTVPLAGYDHASVWGGVSASDLVSFFQARE